MKIIKRTQILLFVPATADIKQLLKDNGYSQSYINAHLDKYHYFLHLIYIGKLYQYNIDDNNGYTLVKDSILNKQLGRYRVEVKENLIKWEVVQCDNSYIVGKKSKGYKITSRYSQSYRQEVCINDIFENNLRNKKAYYSTLKGSVQYLYDMIQSVGIRAEEAQAYILNKLDESTTLFQSINYEHYINYNKFSMHRDLYLLTDTLTEATVEELEKNIYDKYNADLLAINSIDNGIFKISQDAYGRVHTPLTNSSRFLRKFLFNKNTNQPLYSLDLSCSQPFFLNIVLKMHYKQDVPESVQQYIDDTCKGIMYEEMMSELSIPKHMRMSFKKSFFGEVFYCSLYTMNQEDNKVSQAFRKLYPEVHEFIKREKKNQYEGKKLTRDFRHFSRDMQRVESEAFIDKIVRKAQIQRIWLTTIHDACIVLEENVQDIYTIIETVFKEEYRLNPTIKVESLSSQKQEVINNKEPEVGAGPKLFINELTEEEQEGYELLIQASTKENIAGVIEQFKLKDINEQKRICKLVIMRRDEQRRIKAEQDLKVVA